LSKKNPGLSSTTSEPTNKEKTIAINELRQKYPIADLLKFFRLPKSSYYYEIKALAKAELKDKELKDEILKIYNESKQRYGFRRILLALNKDRKDKINHKKVQRLMHELGIFGIQGKNGKYHSYKNDNGEEKVNLLLEKEIDEDNHRTTFKRHFETSKPNEKWTTDVSEFRHKDGKLYLSPILDMYDGSIIAYDLSIHPDFNQTKRMIDKAFEQYDNLEGLIFHSDQGWQYQMKQYGVWLKSRGIKQSFSRKGNCMDNSLMENFFGILKNEMFYGHESKFETLEELKKAIEEYIEWYNNVRINAKRKGLSPIEYRQQSLSQLQY
jgi:transposase InsO family protein